MGLGKVIGQACELYNDETASRKAQERLGAMRGAKAATGALAPILLSFGAPVAVAGGLAVAAGWGVKTALETEKGKKWMHKHII